MNGTSLTEMIETQAKPTAGASERSEKAENAVDRALEIKVAALIVDALGLDVDAASIEPDASLYGEGLGLDSIDILEIALVVSKNYGFQLRSDDDNNQRIFSSLRSLSQHIAARRTK